MPKDEVNNLKFVIMIEQNGDIAFSPKIVQLLSKSPNVILKEIPPDLSPVEDFYLEIGVDPRADIINKSACISMEEFILSATHKTFKYINIGQEINYIFFDDPQSRSPFISKYFHERYQGFLFKQNFLYIPHYALIWKPHDRGIAPRDKHDK